VVVPSTLVYHKHTSASEIFRRTRRTNDDQSFDFSNPHAAVYWFQTRGGKHVTLRRRNHRLQRMERLAVPSCSQLLYVSGVKQIKL
jgi:hypothetical protein